MNRALIAAALAASALAQAAMAQEDQSSMVSDIRGLTLGLSATDMPGGFVNFACGSNGGLPLRPLDDWEDYQLCPADERGLHEVAVEYDAVGAHLADMFVEWLADEEEEGENLWLDKYVGTKIAGHPVVLSVLFDDNGIVQGLRAVTDSRARLDQRRRSPMLGFVVRNHHDPRNWTCETLPLEAGQHPIGNGYVKERCETVYRNRSRMVMSRNFYRKAGQTGRNTLGEFVDGEWESSTRWEVWSLDPNDGAAAIAAAPAPNASAAQAALDGPPEVRAFLAGETRDCPGCDLRRADLLRRDLAGANLSGAILIQAALVEANLAGADLSRADLSEADLSLANLREANLRGALLHQAAFYRADLNLADMSEAYMRGGMLRRARMQRVNLTGAYVIDSDLRGIRLAGATLEGANFGGSTLNEANLVGLDLRGVNLEVTNLISANLAGANLEGAELREADLYDADLSDTNLRQTDFTGARLQAANLMGANLHEAIFRDTVLPSGELHTGPLAAR